MAKKERREFGYNAIATKDRLFEVECPSCKQNFRELADSNLRVYAPGKKVMHSFPIWHSCDGREFNSGTKTPATSFCIGETGDN